MSQKVNFTVVLQSACDETVGFENFFLGLPLHVRLTLCASRISRKVSFTIILHRVFDKERWLLRISSSGYYCMRVWVSPRVWSPNMQCALLTCTVTYWHVLHITARTSNVPPTYQHILNMQCTLQFVTHYHVLHTTHTTNVPLHIQHALLTAHTDILTH